MIPRASGRRFLSAEITSTPLPSPSRMSTTAKAGGAASTCNRPSATVSAVVTEKPRVSIARARRWRKDLSSSTINKVRSAGSSAVATSVMGVLRLVLPAGAAAPSPYLGSANRVSRPHGRLNFGNFGSFFEIGATPTQFDDGAALGRRAIEARQRAAAALDQGLGDKEPEAEAAGFRLGRRAPAAAARDVGFAQPAEDFGRKTGTVVGDRDADFLFAPVGGKLDPQAREIDCVLDQIAEPVEHRGVARAHGFRRTIRRQLYLDGDAEMAR